MAWFDRHVLPDFFAPRSSQLARLAAVRLALAAIGVGLLVLAWRRALLPRPSRQIKETLFQAALIGGAMAGALATTEAILHTRAWHAMKFHGENEPLRISDGRYGWVFVPRHQGHASVAGRDIGYVTDGHGYRVASPLTRIDFSRPTIVFSGESVFAGDGLPWTETIPARVEARTGVQVAVLAVNGYSTDQSLMRLDADLPRFRCPAAVVSIFMTSFLDRNLNQDRGHLDARLQWHPANRAWLMEQFARQLANYRSRSTIENGITMTQAALARSATLARARGAVSLLVVPVFVPESEAERALRERILDARGFPYLLVRVDANRRIPGNLHPDTVGAGLIAAQIVGHLPPNFARCSSPESSVKPTDVAP